jgi:hypothetical protein
LVSTILDTDLETAETKNAPREISATSRRSQASPSRRAIRRLKTALHWKGNPEQRQRIQMVLLRESGMTQPAIAEGR